MLPVYNGQDVVEEVIEHLTSQEIELVVLDNGSTDNTFQICKQYADDGLIKLEKFNSETFDWPQILRILYDMALKLNPDWLIRSSQDELIEPLTKKFKLKKAIENEDSNGYNLIQFDFFDFFMTDNDITQAKLIKEKFLYYSWQYDFAFRAWKFISGTRVEEGAGHYPVFPFGNNYKISPNKFVIRHYRFRNKEQAQRNNSERLKRLNKTAHQKIGWFGHINKISKQKFFEPVNHKILNKYNEDGNWNYEKKHSPFVMSSLPKKSEIFSENGKLLHPPPTSVELNAEIKKKDEQISKIQKEFEERTKWALELEKRIKEKDEQISKIQKEFEERTKWALDLDKKLRKKR